MEKDKANEHTGHLMVSDHRRPRPHVTSEELQVPAGRVVSTCKHCHRYSCVLVNVRNYWLDLRKNGKKKRMENFEIWIPFKKLKRRNITFVNILSLYGK